MKVVEASIAIILVLGALVVISLRSERAEEEDFALKIYPILEEIGKNSTLRAEILTGSQDIETEINSLVESRIKQKQIAHDVKICSVDENCLSPEAVSYTHLTLPTTPYV